MSTQEQINAKESRQIELSNIMASSDAHAAKCIKLGLDFKKTYPQDYAAYTAAREEYNTNETALSTLKEQLYLEKQEEERKRREEEPKGEE